MYYASCVCVRTQLEKINYWVRTFACILLEPPCSWSEVVISTSKCLCVRCRDGVKNGRIESKHWKVSPTFVLHLHPSHYCMNVKPASFSTFDVRLPGNKPQRESFVTTDIKSLSLFCFFYILLHSTHPSSFHTTPNRILTRLRRCSFDSLHFL